MLANEATTTAPAGLTAAPATEKWTREAVTALFEAPFADLLFRAQSVHREHFDPNRVQISQLVSIKTGGCPENCGYCSQSAHFKTGVKPTKLMSLEEVREAARAAKASGVQRLCLGAAWRSPREKDLGTVIEMIQVIKEHGLESCVTLGMLDDDQAQRLAGAGLDYYNHNIDTSREYYDKVATTRSIDDRLATLDRVRHAGIKTCCGGIIGMGEGRADRIGMLQLLANLPTPPESVPINGLMRVSGTPLVNAGSIDGLEFVRTIAVARILMPTSVVRLSAGRENMSDELQALCFLAGANSIFVGEKLLTTSNPSRQKDAALLDRLGIQPMACDAPGGSCS
ncbi:MAG TPA: biotin synthase BioB [Polyangiaceae bacterium]|nr:biotin synthase BioB [Polyangiaceae bacterium]